MIFLLLKVWPFLLEHYSFNMSYDERLQRQTDSEQAYERTVAQWRPFEEFVNLREKINSRLSLRRTQLVKKKRRQLLRNENVGKIDLESFVSTDSGLFLDSTTNGPNESASVKSQVTLGNIEEAEALIKKVASDTTNKADLSSETVNLGMWSVKIYAVVLLVV